ncbi:MAG: winged helix-turn-helix domain-containing protein, partial [Asgard group archaeon]|nr:winged helix-turn-helix domain-containing protein [Asgard group archaeon]
MSKNKDLKKTKENYFALVTDEIEFGIVTALNWFESLNLKKLAVMLDKPESTTLRYIRKLKDNGIIVFDSKKSEDSWGKFYKLSPQIKKTYDAYNQAMDDQIAKIEDEIKDKLDSEEELEKYTLDRLLSAEKLREIPLQKHYFHFVSNLQSIMMNEAVHKIEEFFS